MLFVDDFVCWNHFRQVLLCSLHGWGSLWWLWWRCCCPSLAAGEEKLHPLLRFGNSLWWSWIVWFTSKIICTEIKHIKDVKKGNISPFLMTVDMISATNEEFFGMLSLQTLWLKATGWLLTLPSCYTESLDLKTQAKHFNVLFHNEDCKFSCKI